MGMEQEKPAGFDAFRAKVEEMQRLGLVQAAAVPALLLAALEVAQASWQQGADDLTEELQKMQGKR